MWRGLNILGFCALVTGMLANHVSAQATAYRQGGGACKNNEAGVAASDDEIAASSPYCRTKVGNRTKDQVNTGVYWPLHRRSIKIAPYTENITRTSGSFYIAGYDTDVALQAAVRNAIIKSAETWNRAARSSFNGRVCSDIEVRVVETPTTSKTNRYEYSSLNQGDGINAIVWRTGPPDDTWQVDCSLIQDAQKRSDCLAGCSATDKACIAEDQSRKLAVTQLLYNAVTGEIRDADISMNGDVSYYGAASGLNEKYVWVVASKDNGYVSDTCDDSSGTFSNGCIGFNQDYFNDIQSVVTHELGHLIGFAHVNDSDQESIMYYANHQNQNLSDGDIAGLCQTYPAGDCTPGNYCVQMAGLKGAYGCALDEPTAQHDTTPMHMLGRVLGLAVALAGVLFWRRHAQQRSIR